MDNNTETVIYCDGLCEPKNPGGIATYGWVIHYRGKLARTGNGFVCKGDGATNNVAEYSGLIAALQYLVDKNYHAPITVLSDSQLMIRQLNGEYRVNSPRLLPLYQKAKELVSGFEDVRFEWIPREQNTEADRQSWKAYNEHRHL